MRSKIQFKYLTLTMALGLSMAIFIYSCKKTDTKTPPPVTTSLTSAIDSAKWYLANTKEGTQPGDYTKGTQAALQSALTAGEGVLANTASTQAQITAAAANLNAAITAYKAGLITPIAASSLVAYWKFNGNANDSSGNGHNGTLEAGPAGLAAVPGGMPTLVVDRFGNANSSYHFAGGGNIDVPFNVTLNPKAITVSVWERQDTAGRTDHRSDCYMVSLSRWNGWKFQTQPTRPFLTVNTDTADIDHDGAVDLAIGVSTGAGPWHHLVATYDGDSTEIFYVDGVSVKTWTTLRGAMKTISPTYDLAIGSDLTNSAYSPDITAPNYIGYGGYWTGDLDDIMIYNVALTPTQVTQIYNQQLTQ
jgi:Concanavalin A-like lectin/glucanases superfamily/FIVAR domain